MMDFMIICHIDVLIHVNLLAGHSWCLVAIPVSGDGNLAYLISTAVNVTINFGQHMQC